MKLNQMDGLARGLAETVHGLMNNHLQRDLPDPNKTLNYICGCGRTVDRKELDVLNKIRYVFPACQCDIERREREEIILLRKERRGEMERVYRQNLMNDELTLARFQTFQQRPGTELMLRECKRFAHEFETRKTGMLGFGNPGNGKSHLFVSIHHHVYAEGFVSLFLEVPRLFSIVEDAKKFSSKVSLNDVINAAIKCDLLTLDELGAAKLTQEHFNDVLFPIINGRQGKPTNYTTNLDLDELRAWFAVDKYGKALDSKGRLIDRIIGSCDILANNGTSKRQEDALKRLGD